MLSQNRSDEVLGVRLRPASASVFPADGEILIGRNVQVSDIGVLRGVIWFTDHVTFSSPEQAVEGLPALRNPHEERLHDMVRGTTGHHEEVATHPDRMDEIEAPVANLVDVGFVARTDHGDQACFTWFNSFIRVADFITDDNRDELRAHYELLPLDRWHG